MSQIVRRTQQYLCTYDDCMIDLYYAPTPNGLKIRLFLEEAGLAYRIVPVNLGKGEQFSPEFLSISPNNKIPAIVDHEPKDGRNPIQIFESGAILLYLAEKTGSFMPKEFRPREDALQWLFWQVGGLGPMAGQANHFNKYATEKVPYAIKRYTAEVLRLYGVLEKRLEGRKFIADEYSIADMACYPWIASYGQDLGSFPNIARWLKAIASRPAVKKAYLQ